MGVQQERVCPGTQAEYKIIIDPPAIERIFGDKTLEKIGNFFFFSAQRGDSNHAFEQFYGVADHNSV